MTGWEMTHVIALGLWGGVLMVELVIEGLGLRFEHLRGGVATFHRYIDWFTEVPLLAVITLSGAVLLESATWDTQLMIKVGCGLGAVLITVFATHGVMLRARVMDTNPDQYFSRTLWILGPAGLLGPLFGVALWLGGARGGWW